MNGCIRFRCGVSNNAASVNQFSDPGINVIDIHPGQLHLPRILYHCAGIWVSSIPVPCYDMSEEKTKSYRQTPESVYHYMTRRAVHCLHGHIRTSTCTYAKSRVDDDQHRNELAIIKKSGFKCAK
jgi:hypothetical protein